MFFVTTKEASDTVQTLLCTADPADQRPYDWDGLCCMIVDSIRIGGHRVAKWKRPTRPKEIPVLDVVCEAPRAAELAAAKKLIEAAVEIRIIR